MRDSGYRKQRIDGDGGTSSVEGAVTVLVPEVLRLYFASRCDNPDAMLADLLREHPVYRSFSISSLGDAHRGLRRCELGASTVIKRLPSSVDVTIAMAKGAIWAGLTSTDVILHHLFHSDRPAVSDGLLDGWIDIPILPPKLRIVELLDQGAGATIRCEPMLKAIDLSLPDDDQVVSDACGFVSGSDRHL